VDGSRLQVTNLGWRGVKYSPRVWCGGIRRT